MKGPFKSLKRRQRGQGMSEYLIITALIAIAAIGVFGYFGDVVSNQMAGAAQELAGQDASTDQANAATAADSATDVASDSNTMENYYDNGENGG